MNTMNQIHIDLETLDTARTAQLLSIGAVCGDNTFYRELSNDDYKQYGEFTQSKDTIAWWEDQGGFQYRENPVPVSTALHEFCTWFRGVSTAIESDTEVWANSPSFDCDKINFHLEVLHLPPLWKFYQERDVRTIKSLAYTLHLPIAAALNPHHALQDAINQREFVRDVYQYLNDRL